MPSAQSRRKRIATSAERARGQQLLRAEHVAVTDAHDAVDAEASTAPTHSDDPGLYAAVRSALAHPLVAGLGGLEQLAAEKFLWFCWASGPLNYKDCHRDITPDVIRDMAPRGSREYEAVKRGVRAASEALRPVTA